MLTVDYTRLGARAGDRLLDLGCGAGRHAFEAIRRGLHVTALDYSIDELRDVRAIFGAMQDAGEIPSGTAGAAVNGDACRLPFPDGAFDRIVASEVFEHVPDDVAAFAELARILRPGGTMGITVPAFLPERICWALSPEYHAPHVTGGHVRIYSDVVLRTRIANAGLVPEGAHRAHALHSPYWWLKCAVGPTNAEHPLVKAYLQVLTWDITGTPVVSRVTRTTERLLNPVLGKSLVVYARKPEPAGTPAAAPPRQTARKEPVGA